jgi:exonuclease III
MYSSRSGEARSDILCLQETKAERVVEIDLPGYHEY